VNQQDLDLSIASPIHQQPCAGFFHPRTLYTFMPQSRFARAAACNGKLRESAALREQKPKWSTGNALRLQRAALA
jgi:hypothetical protein